MCSSGAEERQKGEKNETGQQVLHNTFTWMDYLKHYYDDQKSDATTVPNTAQANCIARINYTAAETDCSSSLLRIWVSLHMLVATTCKWNPSNTETGALQKSFPHQLYLVTKAKASTCSTVHITVSTSVSSTVSYNFHPKHEFKKASMNHMQAALMTHCCNGFYHKCWSCLPLRCLAFPLAPNSSGRGPFHRSVLERAKLKR